MAERKKRRFSIHIVLWIGLFAAGFGTGFVVRDRQQHKKVEQAVDEATAELREALERTHRAGEELGKGAKSAADELKGDKP